VAHVGTNCSELDLLTLALRVLPAVDDISSNICDAFCVMNELGKCFENCTKLPIEGLVLMHAPVTTARAVLCAVRNLLSANIPISPTPCDLCNLTLY
jgi:hypothetical protein